MAAEETREDTGRGSEAKRPVGGAQQGLPYRVSFAVVGVEQGGVGVAMLDRGKFPGEVVGILDAGVHALGSDRAVHVRGITGEEHLALKQLMTTLLSTVRAAHPGVDTGPIERAYTTAARLHHGQRRKSGDPYITHPIAVAATVAEMGMSAETVCAALLHDTLEYTDYSPARLREDFGEVVACLVEGVTRLDKIKIGTDEQNQDLRDRVLAISDDPQVIILKLADRLHNLHTIRFVPPTQQAHKA